MLNNAPDAANAANAADAANDERALPAAGALQQQAQLLDIAIISINYHPEPTGISVYSTGMAEFLAAHAHGVTAFTAFPYYPAWSKRQQDQARIYASEVIQAVRVKRCYVYVPAQPTALKRVVHEFSFVLSVALRYLVDRRYAITVIVSPPLALGLVIGALAKLKGSRCVLHVQDLQPDAAIDLGMLRAGRLTRMLFWVEQSGYRLADRISTISQAMCAKIESKGDFAGKTLLFKNWADGMIVKPMDAEQSFKRQWDLRDKFVVLYAGNMGVKQGLGSVLIAAQQLLPEADIVVLLVGDGGEKAALRARAAELGLTNIRFEQPVAQELLGKLLATADVSIITQKSGINDLVLPSKLGNLMTSRRPLVVQALQGSELARIVADCDCGLVIAPEDGIGLAQAILTLREHPARCSAMAERGAEFAKRRLSKSAILFEFAAVLADLATPAQRDGDRIKP